MEEDEKKSGTEKSFNENLRVLQLMTFNFIFWLRHDNSQLGKKQLEKGLFLCTALSSHESKR
jgi:hypothetical protein